MKEILIRAASDGVSRMPASAIHAFLRKWLLGSMAVSAAVCGNAVVQGLIGPIPITQHDLVMLPLAFVIWIMLAAIPVLVVLIMWWILFG